MPSKQETLYTYLNERFRNLDVLGSNEKKRTFLAKDEVSGQIVVKKIIAKENYEIYSRLKELKSDNLVRILHLAQGGEDALVITEYISGETLQTRVEEHRLCSQKQAEKYLLQLVQVLSQIHELGIIHRDISPKNILISTDDVPKLIDFDIGRFYKKCSSHDTTILGTAGYAAPEQFGFIQSDRRTDIYAVGVLLNVMLTGKLPSEQKYAIPPLSNIIEQCTRFEPDKRYQSMEEIKNAFPHVTTPLSFLRSLKSPDEIIWIGFRSGKLWKKRLASSFYVIMGMYSVASIVECAKSVIAFLLEIVAVFNYIWLPVFILFNFLHWMDRLPIVREMGRGGRRTCSILLSLVCFYVGFQLELYVRLELLHFVRT